LGWTEIDLVNKEITISGQYKGLFLFFNVLESKSSDKEQIWGIAFQRGSSQNQYSGFY